MPFGLTNAPATFQHLMETCLGDLNLHWCIIYLDDIVIFFKDPASHLERLEAVFWKLEEAELKLKPLKCELFWWQVAYLGHVIFAEGIALDGGKIHYQKLANSNKCHRAPKFLGICGVLLPVYPKIQAGGTAPA